MKRRSIAIFIILTLIISVASSGCTKWLEKDKPIEDVEEIKEKRLPMKEPVFDNGNDNLFQPAADNEVINGNDDANTFKGIGAPEENKNASDETEAGSYPYQKQLLSGDTDPSDSGTPKEYIDDVKRMYIDTIHNMIMPKLCRITAEYRAEYADSYEYCDTIAEYETGRAVWVHQNKSSLDNPVGIISEMLYLKTTPYCMVAKHLGLNGWIYRWIKPKKWPYTLTVDEFVPDHILKLSDITSVQPIEGIYSYRDYVDEETGEFITGLDVRQAKFEGDDNIYHYYCMWADKNPSYPREVYKSIEGIDAQGRPYRIDIRMQIESDSGISGKYRSDDITSNKADLAKYIDDYMNDNYDNVESFIQDDVLWYKWDSAVDGTTVAYSYDDILDMLDLTAYKQD